MKGQQGGSSGPGERSNYFAIFRQRSGYLLRLDTRVYLEAQTAPAERDPCIGCIIGKNPGSARPRRRGSNWTPITLDGDRFLPNVRSILSSAYGEAGIDAPTRAFLRVLNLFYLCDRDLGAAKAALASVASPVPCHTEAASYPWAWYAWGGPDRILDPLKARFAQLRSDRSFFYDNTLRRVVASAPAAGDRARHTQGLPHAPLVEFLALLLSANQATPQA